MKWKDEFSLNSICCVQVKATLNKLYTSQKKIVQEFNQTLWSNSAIFRTIGTIIGSATDFSFPAGGFVSVSGSLTASPTCPEMQLKKQPSFQVSLSTDFLVK